MWCVLKRQCNLNIRCEKFKFLFYIFYNREILNFNVYSVYFLYRFVERGDDIKMFILFFIVICYCLDREKYFIIIE